MRRNFYFLIFLRFLIAITLIIVFNAFLPIAGNSALAEGFNTNTYIPTVTYTSTEQKEVLAPDWSKITWGNLPPIELPGSIKIPAQFAQMLGYDPSRIWSDGDRPDQFIKLGDIAQAFHPEVFRLSDITDLTGLATKTLNLKDFGLTDWQSPSSLVKAIPGLGQLPVSKVQPIYDLVSQLGNKAALNAKIAHIARDQVLGKIPLGKYLNLGKYSLDSIPGLSKTPIAKFNAWQQSFINQVPGLSKVPFSQMPQPLAIASIRLAYHDLTWSSAETGDSQAPASLTLSGSVNKKGFVAPVPCSAGKPCGYVELGDFLGANGSIYGKRWVSGKVQKVKGGFGPLRILNGGWEPTGLLVYGSAFKVVLLDIDESKGAAKYGLYFRACAHVPLYGNSCSPYFIGPVPWFPTHEKGLVIVASTTKPKVDIPSNYKEQIDQIRNSYQLDPADNELALETEIGQLCPGGEINYNALANAYGTIEGNYSSAGSFVCDKAGNCGRGLGRYQYMSYRKDVRSVISSKPGGTTFLTKARSGAPVSSDEVNQYFSETEQNRLFQQDQANLMQIAKLQTDPRTGKPFTGDRLIQRMGQMHFGGTDAPIDGGGSDVHGRLSLRTYGENLAQNYKKAGKGATSSCTLASAPPVKGSGTATGKLSNPAPASGTVTSDFGARVHPCKGCSSDHKGIDIGIPNGSAVKAADGGTVVYAGAAKGYGNVLVIDHGNGLQTRYAHLQGFSARTGTVVAPGQIVATSDSTGVGTGAHLHFEVRENASPSKSPFDPSIKAVDPQKYVNFKQ